MIKIIKLQIDSTSKKINVQLQTEEDTIISGIYFWDKDTYPKDNEKIDLSNLLTSQDEFENFEIEAEDVNLKYFTGLYFIEFKATKNSEDCDEIQDTAIGVVANTTNLHNCVINILNDITIKECDIYIKGEKNQKQLDKIFLINTLLLDLYYSLDFLLFEDAIDIYNNILRLCYNCTCYKDTGNTLNLAGVKTETCEADCGIGNKITKYPCL
jgi:hypothetical protein